MRKKNVDRLGRCFRYSQQNLLKTPHWRQAGRCWYKAKQDGRGIGWEDHFHHNKIIKRSFECWATSTKQLLNAGGGHQAPKKAAHSLWKEVGQNIKDKKRVKELGMEIRPAEGGVVKEKFPNSRKPSHWRVCGKFWNLRGQHNWEEK